MERLGAMAPNTARFANQVRDKAVPTSILRLAGDTHVPRDAVRALLLQAYVASALPP